MRPPSSNDDDDNNNTTVVFTASVIGRRQMNSFADREIERKCRHSFVRSFVHSFILSEDGEETETHRIMRREPTGATRATKKNRRPICELTRPAMATSVRAAGHDLGGRNLQSRRIDDPIASAARATMMLYKTEARTLSDASNRRSQ
jgi:hypothetical protein